MSLVYCRRAYGFAVLIFALALSATLKGQEIIVGEMPPWTSGPGDARLKFACEMFVSVGCLSPAETYQLSQNGVSIASIPAGSTDYNQSFTKTINITTFYGTSGGSVSGSYDMIFTLTQNARAGVGSSVVDSQTLRLTTSGMLTRATSGAAANCEVTFQPIFSLKPGGPSTGKERIPQEDNTPYVDPDTCNLIYDTPDFYRTADGNTVSQVPPEIVAGNGSIQCQPGVNWIRVKVPGGTAGTSGVPPWFSGSFPSSVRVTGGSAPPNTFFGTTRRYGGEVPSFTGGGLTPGSGGGANLQLFGNGIDGLNIGFPAGYQPIEKDLNPPPPATSSLNVDPCFAVGLNLLDRPPPGIGTQDPNEPIYLPDKLLPPSLPAPGTLPGGLPGGVTPPTSPNKPKDPTLPGTGPGGGTGGGSGGGGEGFGPSLPGEDGEGPSSPGGPLPSDGAEDTVARDWAGKLKEALESIQGKSEGFMSWGEVRSFNPGGAGDWSYSMGVGGTNFTLTIPTWMAPVVRGVLKVLLLATFLTATIKLLIS